MGLPFLPPVKPRWTPARNLTKLYGSNWAWFRPSLSPLNIWQDSAGSNAVTAAAQSVGQVISTIGAPVDPSLVTNGGSSFTNTTDWSSGGAGQSSTLSVVSGKLRVTATSTYGRAKFSVTVTPGKVYELSAEVTKVTADANTFLVALGDSAVSGIAGTVSIMPTSSGVAETLRSRFVATSAMIYVVVATGGVVANTILDVSYISLKETTAGTALQATTANKPTYYTDARNAPVLRHDTTDGLTAAFATTMGSAASVYYANQWGVQQSHGVNVGTSYALPGKPGSSTADVYEWILVPTRPDQKTESEIVKWLTKTAGL